LLQSEQIFNIVFFKGRYYCVPQGQAVDWNTDKVEALPGVAVRDSLHEALELIRSGHMPPSPIPHLLKSINRFNIVLFQGAYYCVPFGQAVDWQKPDVAKLPGVMVSKSLEEAEGRVKNREHSGG
jgi:hypothetical protein